MSQKVFVPLVPLLLIAPLVFLGLRGLERASAQTPGQATLGTPVVQCGGAFANVTFPWTPGPAGADSQFVDLSTFNNNFAPFSFISWGPLSPAANSIQWLGLTPGQQHFWRVSAGVPGLGWVFSRTGTFAPCGPTPPSSPSFVNTACLGTGRASVAWALSNLPFNASGTFIDITLQNNGFLPGTFVGSNATGLPSYTWGGIQPNAMHFWRVNNLTPGGWLTSASGTFMATC
jgi:hypothetical protein